MANEMRLPLAYIKFNDSFQNYPSYVHKSVN